MGLSHSCIETGKMNYPVTATATAPYGSLLLNELHLYFPELLYRPERFQNIQEVLGYIGEVARENPYERERRRHLRSVGGDHREEKQEAEEKREQEELPAYAFQASSSAYSVVPPTSSVSASDPPSSSSSVSASDPPSSSSSTSSTASTSSLHADALIRTLLHRRPEVAPSRLPSSRFRLSVPMNLTSFLSSSEYSAPAPSALQGLSILQDLFRPVVIRPTEEQLAQNTYVYCSDIPYNENCSICQDPMEAGQETRTLLACSHCFHRECIDRWFQENVRCPTCRQDVRESL